MVDIVDAAQSFTQDWLSRALSRKSKKCIGLKPLADCVECGDPIGEARLKVMPGASLCAYCQKEQEHG